MDLDKENRVWYGESSGIWFNDRSLPRKMEALLLTFLWRASLDVVSSLPIASADPFGGVIITTGILPCQAPKAKVKCFYPGKGSSGRRRKNYCF